MEAAGCTEPCKRIDRDLRFSICMIVVGMSLLTAGSLMVILGHVLSAQLDSENANSLAIAGPVSLTISGGFVLPGLCLYFVRKRKSARRLRRIPRSGTELVDLVFSSYPSLSDISPSRNYAPPPSYQEVMQMGLSVYPLSNNRVPSISVLDCTALDIRPDLPDSHAAGHRSPHEGAADGRAAGHRSPSGGAANSHAAGHRSPHEGAADSHAAGHRSPREGAAAQTSESLPTRRETSLSTVPSPGRFQETSLSIGPSPGRFQEASLSPGRFQEASLSPGKFQETSLTEQEPPPKYEDVILT